MSSGDRIPIEKAFILAGGIVNWICDTCEKIEIVGSIRRERETVGDIEIVCLPHNPIALESALATLLEAESIKKKKYWRVDGNGTRKFNYRWGDKLKAFTVHGVTCELFIADKDNYGYIKWLRTGSGDANQWVVTRMKQEKAAMRFDKGYGWICSYQGDVVSYDTKLHLTDEETVFTCLGLGDVIDPKWRRDDVYKANWKGVLPGYMLVDYRADEPKQQKLF